MEIDGLISDNKILIYSISIFYILINDTFNKKQKNIILYVLTYTFKLFNIMNFKIMLTTLNIVAFLYIGFLSKDYVKNNILCNIWYKIKDYIYKIIFEYSAIYFFISVILISNIVQNYIPVLKYCNINIELLEVSINVISIIFLGIAINNITSQKYETNSFQDIKDKMDKIAIWREIKKEDIDIKKQEMLINIEDKSYFQRENSYNFISIEFLKYKLCKTKETKINSNINFNKIKKFFLKKIYIKNILNKVRKYIRGYSTIEMQIIRTLGIKYGYNKLIWRKIYEILYSKMFFKSLRKYMNKIYLDTSNCCTFKEYLLYIYIKIAPIKLNDNRYDNMLSPWKVKSLKTISKEKFFISILGLSNRKITNKIIQDYYNIVKKYKLSTKKLRKLIKSVNDK